MSEVLSIRIPRDLKKRMKELEGLVDWKEEIVKFLEERVRYYRRFLAIKRAHEVLASHPLLPRGSAVESVRGDRDSR